MSRAPQYIIGLSGGIGSGKTTVSDQFKALGIDIIDADIISHQVTAPGQPSLKRIEEHLGRDAFFDDGRLNRAWMRQHVFSHPDDKAWLEGLLHPLIGDAIIKAIEASASPYTIFVSPLLLSSPLKSMCKRILIVNCSDEQQIERTKTRDNSSEETIKSIIKAQTSRQQRLKEADDVIENSGDIPHLHKQVLELHEYYLKLAATR